MYKILITVFICLILFSACSKNQIILPDGKKLKAELALTQEQKERGLMFREELPQDQGMLFIFERDDWRFFWMKNTLIDLDMLFLDSSGVITSISEEVPHSYLGAPEEEIATAAGFGKYVLEINSGAAKQYNLKTGDRLDLKNIKVK